MSKHDQPVSPAIAWQPIETMPKDRRSTFVIASFPKRFFGVTVLGRIDNDAFTTISGDFYAPTHWCLLPSDPEVLP